MANVAENFIVERDSKGSEQAVEAKISIHELNERRRAALAEIDSAPFSYVELPNTCTGIELTFF